MICNVYETDGIIKVYRQKGQDGKLYYPDLFDQFVAENISTLFEILQQIHDVRFESLSVHLYYWELKAAVTSFFNYWEKCMKQIVEENENLQSEVTFKDMELFFLTATKAISSDFYLRSPHLSDSKHTVARAFKEIQKRTLHFKDEMLNLVRSQSTLKDAEFSQAIDPVLRRNIFKWMQDVFDGARCSICMILVDKICRLRDSVLENKCIVVNSLKKLDEDASSNDLQEDVPRKNKQRELSHVENEDLSYTLQPPTFSEELKSQLEYLETTWTLLDYVWRKFDNLIQQESMYTTEKQSSERIYRLKRDEIPTMKSLTTHAKNEALTKLHHLWRKHEARYTNELTRITQEKLDLGQALIDQMRVQGIDRVLYNQDKSEEEQFYIDEYGHRVYPRDGGLREYHVECDGTLKNVREYSKSLYCQDGRYIQCKGTKVFKRAPCASSYLLNDGLMTKVTKDCGHSADFKKDCLRDAREPSLKSLLPDSMHDQKKEVISREAAVYLWDNLAGALSLVLYEIAMAKPKQPIYHLARKLLHLKNGYNRDKLVQSNEEARRFREMFSQKMQEAKDDEIAAWKSTQPKAPRVEDFDDDEADNRYVIMSALSNCLMTLPDDD